MTPTLRLLAIAAACLLAACEGSGFDLWPSVGEGLKYLCRTQSNCSVHDSESAGR